MLKITDRIISIVIIAINSTFLLYFVIKAYNESQWIWLVFAIIQLMLIGITLWYLLLDNDKIYITDKITVETGKMIIILGILSLISNVLPIIIYIMIQQMKTEQITESTYRNVPPNRPRFNWYRINTGQSQLSSNEDLYRQSPPARPPPAPPAPPSPAPEPTLPSTSQNISDQDNQDVFSNLQQTNIVPYATALPQQIQGEPNIKKREDEEPIIEPHEDEEKADELVTQSGDEGDEAQAQNILSHIPSENQPKRPSEEPLQENQPAVYAEALQDEPLLLGPLHVGKPPPLPAGSLENQPPLVGPLENQPPLIGPLQVNKPRPAASLENQPPLVGPLQVNKKKKQPPVPAGPLTGVLQSPKKYGVLQTKPPKTHPQQAGILQTESNKRTKKKKQLINYKYAPKIQPWPAILQYKLSDNEQKLEANVPEIIQNINDWKLPFMQDDYKKSLNSQIFTHIQYKPIWREFLNKINKWLQDNIKNDNELLQHPIISSIYSILANTQLFNLSMRTQLQDEETKNIYIGFLVAIFGINGKPELLSEYFNEHIQKLAIKYDQQAKRLNDEAIHWRRNWSKETKEDFKWFSKLDISADTHYQIWWNIGLIIQSWTYNEPLFRPIIQFIDTKKMKQLYTPPKLKPINEFYKIPQKPKEKIQFYIEWEKYRLLAQENDVTLQKLYEDYLR